MKELQDLAYEFNQFIGQFGGFSEDFRSSWCLCLEKCNYTLKEGWAEVSLAFRNGAKIERNFKIGTTWFFIQSCLSKELCDFIATRSRSFSEQWDTDLFDSDEDELLM